MYPPQPRRLPGVVSVALTLILLGVLLAVLGFWRLPKSAALAGGGQATVSSATALEQPLDIV
ncbi:MAG TPA: hypothetical protein VII06_08360 [Chloroflexota bacterium]|jgi:asparagine N-glycosylation enzyme membrane subunit Stt3